MQPLTPSLPVDIIGIGMNAPGWSSRTAFLRKRYFASANSDNQVAAIDLSPQERLYLAIQDALTQIHYPSDPVYLISSREAGVTQLAVNWLTRRTQLPGTFYPFNGDQAWLPNMLEEVNKKLEAAPLIILTFLNRQFFSQPGDSTDWEAVAFACARSSPANQPVYARLAGFSVAPEQGSSDSRISFAVNEAVHQAGVSLKKIELLSLITSNDQMRNTSLFESLEKTFSPAGEAACAFYVNSTSESVAFAESLLAQYHRFFPSASAEAGPFSTSPRNPFFRPDRPLPWFIEPADVSRWSGLVSTSSKNELACLVLETPETLTSRENDLLTAAYPRLIPIAANSGDQLIAILESLQSNARQAGSLHALSRAAYQELEEYPGSPYRVSLVANSLDELDREIGFAVKGVPAAIEQGKEWQTPNGSYFTPQPLGQSGSVAFVYPGAFNTFLNLGRDLLQLFPQIYPLAAEVSRDLGEVLKERMLYPRSFFAFDPSQTDELEAQLNADPVAMLTSGSGLAVLYTLLMRNVFQLQPKQAFGYSLGECSMLFALQAWSEGDAGSQILANSPLFRTRLSGPKQVLREQWGLPEAAQDPAEGIWSNLLLMASPSAVREAIRSEPRVFLTHINTPRQVVIAGEPAACRRVAARLKCPALQAPFEQVLHCDPVRQEYAELTRVNTFPTHPVPEIHLFSAARYTPVQFDSQVIAQGIAEALCSCLDFPRLIQQVFEDGARIFIELGAGSNCSRWVDETLKGQPHLAVAISRKGSSDMEGIVRLLARLVSHAVPIDISYLYKDEILTYAHP